MELFGLHLLEKGIVPSKGSSYLKPSDGILSTLEEELLANGHKKTTITYLKVN